MPADAPILMDTPYFGKCRLLPHAMDEEPAGPVCYIERAAMPGRLSLAVHKGGVFRDHKLKPISEPISAWYSVERADGRPLF
jgi:hypothetical protein